MSHIPEYVLFVSLQYIGVNTFLYIIGSAGRCVVFTHIQLSFIFGYYMMNRFSIPLGAKCGHVT